MTTFKVLILGPTHSGKSVFLASLYRELSVQGSTSGFFLDVPLTQAAALNDIYAKVANPNTAWPPRTDPRYTPVFRFDCTVVGAKDNYQAFTIEYLDYSGENFIQTNLDPATLEAFEGYLASADVLLGLLDGQQIMKLLDGDSTASITYETTHLAPVLQQMVRHRVPVHFVLTKWDLLLDAYGGSEADLLTRVRERLLALRQFADAVQLRRRYNQGAMRLIPVSAVGRGFTRLDGAQVVKVGSTPHPVNVEVPFMAVIPDFLQTWFADLAEQERVNLAALVADLQRRRDKMGAADWALARARDLQVPVTRVLARGSNPKGKAAADAAFRMVMPFLERLVSSRKATWDGRIDAATDASAVAVDDAATAMKGVVDAFAVRLEQFSAQYPAADLLRES